MKYKEDGYFLNLYLSAEEIDFIPSNIRNTTGTGAKFMLLGNEREVALLKELFPEIPEECFRNDWFLVYEEK